jgi:hypothetical protein
MEEKKEKARIGRPPKSAVAPKKQDSRLKLGRPPGEAARIQEFKARLLGTTGDRIMNTLIRKAMDDEDKDQFAALKFCAERILPMSAFDTAKSGGTTPVVTINISSLSTPQTVVLEDATDIAYKEQTE